MKKLMMSLLVLAGVGLLAPVLAAGTMVDIVPKGTKVVGQINFAKFRSTQMYESMRTKNLRKMRIFQDAIYLKTGMDLDKVNSVWFMGVKEQEGLIILKGDFDTGRIIDTVKASQENEIQTVKNTAFAVLVPNKRQPDKKNLAVILDDKTIAVGNPDYVKSLVETFNGRGETLSKEEQALVSSACNGSSLVQAALISVDQEAVQKLPLLATVRNASVAMDVISNNVKMDVKLKAIDAQNAQSFAKILDGMVNLYKHSAKARTQPDVDQRKGRGIARKLIDSLKVSSQGDMMSMSANIPETDVVEVIKLSPGPEGKDAPEPVETK